MVKLNSGKGLPYLKADDVKKGDAFTLLDEGQWVESKFTYDDGNPKQDLMFKVEHNKEEKQIKCNKFSQEELSKEWGTDTAEWKGKSFTVEIERIRSLGKDMIIMKPTQWED